MLGLWPFGRRGGGSGAEGSNDKERHSFRRVRDIEMPESSESSRTYLGRAMDKVSGLRRRAGGAEAEAADSSSGVTAFMGSLERALSGGVMEQEEQEQQQQQHQQQQHRLNQQHLAASHPRRLSAAAAAAPSPPRRPDKQTSLPNGSHAAGLAWGPAPAPLPCSPLPLPHPSPLHPHHPNSRMAAVIYHDPSSPCAPPTPDPGPGPASPPCPLRPGPPTSTSGMRTESFTSGTGGRLLRPGVGIGAGTMREARYEDLRLIQQIGEGGFGKVYYGHWCGSPVAIKVATPHAEEAGRQLQEFQREVTNMSTIPTHANVLKLLAACMDPQHLALVTEFCSRGSLYNLLHAPGAVPLVPHQLLALWLGVARGMQHLHACRVLHRDLKSANLLLDDVGIIKIGDFGLSRVCSGQAVQQAMTGGLGTYQWMAPEVLTSQRYSDKADVYSFGMVMWESCTCKMPYEGMTAMQAGLRVAAQGLRPLIPATVQPAQAQLIRDCWAAVSDQRPSFTQVVARLEGMLGELEQPRSLMPCGREAGRLDTGRSQGVEEQHPRPPSTSAPQQQQGQGQGQGRGRQPQLVLTLPGHVDDDALLQQQLRQEQEQWQRQQGGQAQQGQAQGGGGGGGGREHVLMEVRLPSRAKLHPGGTPVLV